MEWIEHSINGVPGHVRRERDGERLRVQEWMSEARVTPRGSYLRVEVRHDDSCKNGRPSFAVTGEEKGNGCVAGGCLHEEIAETFPELKPLLKWHLCFTDGPLHYLANTMFLAGDKDHWGKEGCKERELDSARRAAIWPEATDDELCSPPPVLEGLLLGRLPALLGEFREVVESIGFEWD